MPRPRESFGDLRPLEFRAPGDVLDEESLYTVREIARLLQGLDPDADLDPATEDILLDWAIPWMLDHADAFVFAEPDADDEPGYYGLR
jgi:hypothetical protein